MKLQSIEKKLKEFTINSPFWFNRLENKKGMFSAYMQGDNPCGEGWEEYIEFPMPKTSRELAESLSSAIWEIYDSFDIEDNVCMWLEAKKNGCSGVPCVVELVHNEEYKENELEKFAFHLNKIVDKEAE